MLAGQISHTMVTGTNPRHCHYSPLDDSRERDEWPEPRTDGAITNPAHTAGVRGIILPLPPHFIS